MNPPFAGFGNEPTQATRRIGPPSIPPGQVCGCAKHRCAHLRDSVPPEKNLTHLQQVLLSKVSRVGEEAIGVTAKSRRNAAAYWLYLIPIEAKEVLLVRAPVSGPAGTMPSAKYPSFDQLRLVLSAVAGIAPNGLDEAARALAADRSYGIYKVMLTEEDLRRLGLSA